MPSFNDLPQQVQQQFPTAMQQATRLFEEAQAGLGPEMPDVDISPATVSRAAPPPHSPAALSVGSKVGLGLLASAAAVPIGYGLYRGYQHLTAPHPEEVPNGEAPAELPKTAHVTAQDIRAANVPSAPPTATTCAARDAWARFGF